MRQTRKIVQISDLHLRADAAAVLHGWRVEAAWQRVRRDAQEKHPDADAWILSGDLVDDETVTGYQRLDAQLATLERPVLALAGNHDDPAAMRRHLHHAHVHECIQLGAWHLFALDSHVDGRDAGRIGQAAIAWLDDALHRTPGPCLICVHHPPLPLGSAWLDAIGLADGAALCAVIRAHPHVAAVLCGHAHQAFETSIGTAHCWVTPATMRQFLPGAAAFALDTVATPGYRVVYLHADGRATSHVERLDQAAGQASQCTTRR